MDSNEFERERGITIASKYTSFEVGAAWRWVVVGGWVGGWVLMDRAGEGPGR